jgi:hypothetical protein
MSKAFIGAPMLGFVIGLAVYWVVDGFRRSTQLGEPPQVSQDEQSDRGK